MILCGGKGTRIRGVADDLPKPMIPVGDYPIMWHIMKSYAHYGHKDFVLLLGYRGWEIKDFFLNYRARLNDFTIQLGDRDHIDFHNVHAEADWRVTFAETGQETLTGSRLKRAQKYLGDDEHFMLTYGDGVGDIDMNELIAFHKSHGKILTVSGVRPPGRFGEIATKNGQVIEFNEKPQATGGRISGGFFVCRREIFDYLDAGRDDITLEADPMRRLARDGQMMMYEHDGFWQCMDPFRDYQLLNGLFADGQAPWVKW